MKKNIVKIVVAAVLFIAVFFTYKTLTAPEVVVGEKAITIIIVDGQDNRTILEKTYDTDAELLGDLLDELSGNGEIKIEFSGSKTDMYGRYITALGKDTLLHSDGVNGPWWLYDSNNNAVCVANQYCPGVDELAIEDNDEFVFTLTYEY